MPDIVVPDTSSLIALECARQSGLLGNLYGRVLVPPGVRDEFAEALPDRAEVVAAQNELLVRSLRSSLGKGESEVIALALENEDAVAILDDPRTRRVARDLGVRFTGTAGIC
jgi:predicted nucleic acid-binding protein